MLLVLLRQPLPQTQQPPVLLHQPRRPKLQLGMQHRRRQMYRLLTPKRLQRLLALQPNHRLLQQLHRFHLEETHHSNEPFQFAQLL